MSRHAETAGLPMMIIASMTIAVGLYLLLSALMVMDGDVLNHLPELARWGAVVAGGAGVILGTPISLLVGQLAGGPGFEV